MKFNLNIKKYVFVGAAILCLSTSSCINDLDQNPIRVLYVSCADCCPLSYTLPMKPFGTGKMKV